MDLADGDISLRAIGFFKLGQRPAFTPLDFFPERRQSLRRRMKRKTVAFTVCLVYVMVALFGGNLPHHHHAGGALAPDSHCAT